MIPQGVDRKKMPQEVNLRKTCFKKEEKTSIFLSRFILMLTNYNKANVLIMNL